MNSIVVSLLMIFALPQTASAFTSMYGSGVWGGSQACPYKMTRAETNMQKAYSQQGGLEHNLAVEEENIDSLNDDLDEIKDELDKMYKSRNTANYVLGYGSSLSYGINACPQGCVGSTMNSEGVCVGGNPTDTSSFVQSNVNRIPSSLRHKSYKGAGDVDSDIPVSDGPVEPIPNTGHRAKPKSSRSSTVKRAKPNKSVQTIGSRPRQPAQTSSSSSLLPGTTPNNNEYINCEPQDDDFCYICNGLVNKNKKNREEFNAELFCQSSQIRSEFRQRGCVSLLEEYRALNEELDEALNNKDEIKADLRELDSKIRQAERKNRRGKTEGRYDVPCPTGNCGDSKVYDFVKNIGMPILAGYAGYRGVKYVSDTNKELGYPGANNAGLLGGMLALQGIYGTGASGVGQGAYGCAQSYNNGGVAGSILGAAALAGGVQFPGMNQGSAFSYPQQYYQTPQGGGLFNQGVMSAGGMPGYNYGVNGNVGFNTGLQGNSGFPSGLYNNGFQGIQGNFNAGFNLGAGNNGNIFNQGVMTCYVPPCPGGTGYPGTGINGGLNGQYYQQQMQFQQQQMQLQMQIQQEQYAKYQQWSELNQQMQAIQSQMQSIYSATGGYNLGVSGSVSVGAGVNVGPGVSPIPLYNGTQDSGAPQPTTRGQ